MNPYDPSRPNEEALNYDAPRKQSSQSSNLFEADRGNQDNLNYQRSRQSSRSNNPFEQPGSRFSESTIDAPSRSSTRSNNPFEQHSSRQESIHSAASWQLPPLIPSHLHHARVAPATAASPTHAPQSNHVLPSQTVVQTAQLQDRSRTHQSSARTSLVAATHASVLHPLASAFRETNLTVRSISFARRSRLQIEHHISSVTTFQALT